MKDLIRLFWLLFCFLCVIITASGQADFRQADQYFEAGSYRQANLAYEWLASQSEETAIQSQARLGRARALKKMGELERALEVLSGVNLMGSPADLRPAIVYEELIIRSLTGDYQGVLAKSRFTQSLMQTGEYQAPFLVLQAIAAYESGDFEKGKEFAKEYLNLVDLREGTQFRTQFDTLTNRPLPKLKKVRKAELLSTFLPGSGQWYAGYPGEGALSFSLHALGLGGAVWAAFGGYYVTAWMGAALIIQQLYTGGRDRATELATKKNRLETDRYLQPILQFLTTIGFST